MCHQLVFANRNLKFDFDRRERVLGCVRCVVTCKFNFQIFMAFAYQLPKITGINNLASREEIRLLLGGLAPF